MDVKCLGFLIARPFSGVNDMQWRWYSKLGHRFFGYHPPGKKWIQRNCEQQNKIQGRRRKVHLCICHSINFNDIERESIWTKVKEVLLLFFFFSKEWEDKLYRMVFRYLVFLGQRGFSGFLISRVIFSNFMSCLFAQFRLVLWVI